MTDPGPPRGAFPGIKWFTDLYNWVKSMQPIRSPDMRLRVTPKGTSFSPIVRQIQTGKGGTLAFKGQWDTDTSYAVGDIVICDDPTELEDGTMAGLYICTNDVGGTGNPEPSADLTPYPPGDESTGHWRLMARGNWKKLVFRVPTPDDSDVRKIVIDCSDQSLTLWANAGDPTQGKITISVTQLAGVITAGDSLVMQAYSDTFCVGTGIKRLAWLRTDMTSL